MSSEFNLKDKVVVITGGTGIQGPEHAKAFRKAGAKVVVTGITNEAEVIIDVTDKKSIKAGVEKILDKHGRIDVLINNAGATNKSPKSSKKIEDQSLEEWDHFIKVNLTGVFLCSQIIGQVMAKQGEGIIINIASVYGFRGPDFSIYNKGSYDGVQMGLPAAYAASKGGVLALTKYLATYWADQGIRVNCVTPGGIHDNQSIEFVKAYSRKTPLKRMAKKSEVSGALLYLASDLASYVTGENIVVDGGISAQL